MSLVVRTPNWLGDLVMSLPAISLLAEEYPQMSLWSHPGVSGLIPVFYGSREEEAALHAISSEVPCADVRTDLTLPGLVSHLLSAVLTVGNDSGGVHVSAALGIPTVTVFGSSSPVWTAPMGNFTETVKSDRVCSPCFKRNCPYGIPECLNDISTEAVLAACERLMKKAEISDV